MRAFLPVLLMLLATLAGCSDGGDRGSRAAPAPEPLTAADITLPTQGSPVLQEIANGFAAVWSGVQLPLVAEVTVPTHATMIRAVADSGAGSVSMSNLETGRRRCNNPTVEDFSESFAYPKSCSSVAALDGAGAVWRVSFSGTGTGDVRIEYLDAALDGPLAHLDLSLIDRPTQSLQDTEILFVPSFDGVRLRVEVTRPEGSGPWPAVIVSSPYYTHINGALPADWTYVVQDWAKRGYAMVTADVRGFADSGGCVEVWGINEQKDQKFLVDWVAEQTWSDGNVGFYGQSYVGTTPVEAAVHAPAALKAIVTIAPVINAYEDWHYGGVPNGESELSPVAYQVLTESTVTEAPAEIPEGAFLNDPLQIANNAANGLCDPTLVARANDPRAVYNAFFEERNFKLRAKDVKAAVLYTEGFEDANVKAAMIPGWFNDLQSPKLGLFGHWLHQHPSRLDCEALFVGWFEHYLKGKDLGFEGLAASYIQVDRDTQRAASEWPPSAPTNVTLWPKFGANSAPTGGELVAEPVDGRQVLYLDSTGAGVPAQGNVETTLPPLVVLRGALPNQTSLAGVGIVHMVVVPQNAPNAYVAAYLWEETPGGDRLVTWGEFNVAHRNGHDRYEPAMPNQDTPFDLPLRPTEHIFPAGATIRLELRGVTAPEATDPFGSVGARLFIEAGSDGTRLILPGVPMGEYEPIPLTARP